MPHVFLDNTAILVANIFCIGRNYAGHIAELGNKRPDSPLVFLKPTSALTTENNLIQLPAFSSTVGYETEIILLVGKAAKQIKPEQALDYIDGYGVGLDLTARDLQAAAKTEGLPWAVAKGFDHSACVSKFIPPSELEDVNEIYFEMKQNGVIRQTGCSKNMLFSIPLLIAYLSNVFTLQRGDLIFTGTPEGVGRVNKGDKFELTLAGKEKAYFSVAVAESPG